MTAQYLEIRVQQLEAENAWLRERHAEAVAQLQPTIEVLEAFEAVLGTAKDRGSVLGAWSHWRITQMRPHLSRLKALAKEAEV